jgi:hypothetical protein
MTIFMATPVTVSPEMLSVATAVRHLDDMRMRIFSQTPRRPEIFLARQGQAGREGSKGSAGDPLAQQGVDDHVAITLPADHIVSTEGAESGLDS